LKFLNYVKETGNIAKNRLEVESGFSRPLAANGPVINDPTASLTLPVVEAGHKVTPGQLPVVVQIRACLFAIMLEEFNGE
jgi:hypothetical protein